MNSKIYTFCKASFVFLLIVLNTFIFGTIFLIAIPFKLIFRENLELKLSILLNFLATTWISVNNFFFNYISRIKFRINIPDDIKTDEWYLILSNHRTWSDIFVLQYTFNRRAPFLKFFLKKELIFVPVIGFSWWALDFPFMKRYSREYIEKNPHMKGKDLETTIKSCEKFKYKPVSVMNFPEGTRNRKGKAQKMKSPYKNLIRPKAGGFSFVLEAMNGKINKILDVTIFYSSKNPSLIDFLAGNIDDIYLEAESIDVEDWMVGSYIEDNEYKKKIQNFLNDLWKKKDKKIEEFNSKYF